MWNTISDYSRLEICLFWAVCVVAKRLLYLSPNKALVYDASTLTHIFELVLTSDLWYWDICPVKGVLVSTVLWLFHSYRQLPQNALLPNCYPASLERHCYIIKCKRKKGLSSCFLSASTLVGMWIHRSSVHVFPWWDQNIDLSVRRKEIKTEKDEEISGVNLNKGLTFLIIKMILKAEGVVQWYNRSGLPQPHFYFLNVSHGRKFLSSNMHL